MGITYEILTGRNLLWTTWAGDIKGGEILSRYTQIYQDPLYEAEMNQFADLSGVAKMDVGKETMQDMVSLRNQLFPGVLTKTAVYAPGDLQFGLVRAFGAYAEFGRTEDVRPFRDSDAARAWLQEHGAD